MAAHMPVEQAIPQLREALREHGSVVLVAEPGAGKTTRVPIALLDEPWLAGKKIVMLEPRKLAARNAARYMASTLGGKVGETIGYRVRMDTKVGPRTRVEVVTEGVLTRMLQSDPSLEKVGLVIFDEFHERSLQADLGLALALQCRALFREDIRIAVMSATLEAEPVALLLDGAPIVKSEGRMFPVETRYASRKVEGTIEAETAAVVLRALAEQGEGDVLVFLPGAGEIRRVEAKLRAALEGRAVDVAPLHGSLPQEAQDRALAPAMPGRRKVVLSTAVAESSLTVEGVRIVVDGGKMRVPRFSPRTGMARLETIPVSLASADQRRGRAGRLAAGVCYRLWTEEENRHLAAVGTPEILAADLAGLALDLAVWGVDNPEELAWLDAPAPAAYNHAKELLTELGALTEEGKLTAHGEKMARFGVHPRLAHMLLRSVPLGLSKEAGQVAALLGERDLLRGDSSRSVDLSLRVRALRQGGGNVDDRVRERLLTEAAELRRSLAALDGEGASAAEAAPVEDALGVLLGFAYPDRIGRRRGAGRYTLSVGRGAELPEGQLLAQAEYLVVAELDDQGQEGRVQLAAALAAADLERHFASSIRLEETVRWDAEVQAVRARETRRLGAIVLSERPLAKPSPEKVAQALLQGLRQEGLAMLPWSRSARQLQERGIFLAANDPAWPDWSDAALLDSLEDWLAPYLGGMKSRADLQRLNLVQALESSLSWEQRSALDKEAPTHITVPSGSRIAVDYSNAEAPFIAVRLQEMFGLPDTPRIARGRVPLTVHLLSPAQRPVQVTRDLASFWSNTYFEVRKDLKGRYPKHYWPDDPMEATATRRVRPPGS